MSAPDPATAELERIRAEANIDLAVRPHDCAADWPACTAHNALRLVAVLEAVLKRHVQIEKLTRLGPPVFRVCADCDQIWPCPTVEDITRSLAGKEASDE